MAIPQHTAMPRGSCLLCLYWALQLSLLPISSITHICWILLISRVISWVKWVLNTYNEQTWLPLQQQNCLCSLTTQGDARGAAPAEAPWHARPRRTGRATTLSWAQDFGCWAFLQAYLLLWASYLTCVLGVQPKSKAVVILLSICVSPGFSKHLSGQGLSLTRVYSSHDPNREQNACMALLYRTGQHAPPQTIAHSPLLVNSPLFSSAPMPWLHQCICVSAGLALPMLFTHAIGNLMAFFQVQGHVFINCNQIPANAVTRSLPSLAIAGELILHFHFLPLKRRQLYCFKLLCA